jgi:predicted AAA+ superfamily ATPase
MEILLEELYKLDLSHERFHSRKAFLNEGSYQIIGVSNSGKTALVKSFLLTCKKNSYLYIDCNDVRIEIDTFNKTLPLFCKENGVETLIFDNYKPEYLFPNVTQIIITSQITHDLINFKKIKLYPLDYEEFLAFEHKYDSSALNHFFQLGGFPSMHTLQHHERSIYIQKILLCSLHEIEFDIIKLCAKFTSQKISPYTIYERLKATRKISKDKLYHYFENMVTKSYIHLLEKFEHPRATKKVYLCDTSIKAALSIEKNFSTLFENMVFLELLKSHTQCFYADKIDFYIPTKNEIILCKPFADERRLFKKLESIEAFLVTHAIETVTVITMNKEGSITHPLSKVDIIPFDIWALGD